MRETVVTYVDTTVASPPTSAGQARRRGDQYAGHVAAKNPPTQNFLPPGRCCLAVLAIEAGGRFCAEAVAFLRPFSQARARAVPGYLL